MFHLDPTDYSDLAAVRDVLLGHLADAWPGVLGAADPHTLAAAYLAKMFITPKPETDSDDAWALFTMAAAVPGTPALDLKFVQRLARPYQFSLNSFQILLPVCGETLQLPTAADASREILNAPSASALAPDAVAKELKQDDSEDTADTVDTVPVQSPSPRLRAVCMYGNAAHALQHITDHVVAVREERDVAHIHGGGLLKYASLLSRGYTVAEHLNRPRLEALMISRFQIDYPVSRRQGGMDAQSQRICHFMATHMPNQYPEQANFLLVLHDIAQRTTLPEVPLIQISLAFVRSAQQLMRQMYLAGHMLPPPSAAAAVAYANLLQRSGYAFAGQGSSRQPSGRNNSKNNNNNSGWQGPRRDAAGASSTTAAGASENAARSSYKARRNGGGKKAAAAALRATATTTSTVVSASAPPPPPPPPPAAVLAPAAAAAVVLPPCAPVAGSASYSRAVLNASPTDSAIGSDASGDEAESGQGKSKSNTRRTSSRARPKATSPAPAWRADSTLAEITNRLATNGGDGNVTALAKPVVIVQPHAWGNASQQHYGSR